MHRRLGLELWRFSESMRLIPPPLNIVAVAVAAVVAAVPEYAV